MNPSGFNDLFEIAEASLRGPRALLTQEFENLEDFARVLLAMPSAIEAAQKKALNEAAKIIKIDAREQIGQYQAAVGNYPAWEPLAESTEDEKARLGAPPDAPLERFGDLKKSFRSTLVGADEVIVGSTDPVMTYHEFGTSRMPPRPVLGPALFKHIEQIRELLGYALFFSAVIVGQHLGYRFSASEGGIAQQAEEE